MQISTEEKLLSLQKKNEENSVFVQGKSYRKVETSSTNEKFVLMHFKFAENRSSLFPNQFSSIFNEKLPALEIIYFHPISFNARQFVLEISLHFHCSSSVRE